MGTDTLYTDDALQREQGVQVGDPDAPKFKFSRPFCDSTKAVEMLGLENRSFKTMAKDNWKSLRDREKGIWAHDRRAEVGELYLYKLHHVSVSSPRLLYYRCSTAEIIHLLFKVSIIICRHPKPRPSPSRSYPSLPPAERPRT